MDYRVDYPSSRTVNVWVRSYGLNGSSDSVWVGIDGDSSNAIRINAPNGSWGWTTSSQRLTIPAGAHTINVWMREDGTVFDRLLLTPSSTRPSGNGPAESSRGNAPPDSPDNTWPVAQDDTFDVVNDGTSHALSVLADNGNGVDFDPDGDTVSVTSVDSSGSAGGSVTVNASSDGLIYTPANGQTGTDTFDYTISDGNGGTGSATVTVNVTASGSGGSDDSGGSSGSGAYQPDGSGQVVIEAENFDANVSRAGRDWVPEYRSGYVGSSAMHAIPNNNVRILSNISSNSPRMDYRVDYPSSRTVNVWVRSYGLNGSSDSVWVGIDGDSSNAIRINAPNGSWGWTTSSQRLTIPAGAHTINVWMREDGTVFDRLLLTPSSTQPSGNGPAESNRDGESSGGSYLGSATLTWTPPTRNEDGSSLTDLAGYRFYWGTSSGNYPNSVTVNNSGISTYVIENLAPGNYEFVSTSFNSSGVESRRSNPATITIE